MPVSKSRLGVLNPVTSENNKHPSSQWERAELIRDVTEVGAFSNTNHLMELMEERCNGQTTREDVNCTKLKGLVRDLNFTDQSLILRAKSTGAWLNVRGTTVTSTVFLATEFRDFLFARYNVNPPNL